MSTNTFPKQIRLLKKDQFQFVLKRGKKNKSRFFHSFSAPNECGYTRLGIIIAKTLVKRAIDRNLIKRIARESFRKHKKSFKNLDIVVRVRSECRPRQAGAKSINTNIAKSADEHKKYKSSLKTDIDYLWQQILDPS